MVSAVPVAGRLIGPREPCFIIAEAGVNHNGDLNLARRLIDAAVAARADAVKFQTFRAERLATRNAPKAAYQRQATDPRESQFEMLKRLELSESAHQELMAHCQRQGILFLSTPFEEESADFLERLGIAAFKIASGELTNWPFLAHVARKDRPVILSTGMATLEEVRGAIEIIRANGNPPLVLLHCVSRYPADASDANLQAMRSMVEAFGVPVGFSDHTLGITVAVAARALGACVIEKHITLDRTLAGPDHQMSLEPEGLRALVKDLRLVEAALGDGRKVPAPGEAAVAAVARKSLVAARRIPSGSPLTRRTIDIKRPGTGLPPSMLSRVVGRRAAKDIPAGTVLSEEMLR